LSEELNPELESLVQHLREWMMELNELRHREFELQPEEMEVERKRIAEGIQDVRTSIMDIDPEFFKKLWSSIQELQAGDDK
jgi:hypothetical protein